MTYQIVSSLILGYSIIYCVPNSALNACIFFMDKICACYFAEVECYNERDKILMAKSINKMPMYPPCTRFRFLIQNSQVSLTFYLGFHTKPFWTFIFYYKKLACIYFHLLTLFLGVFIILDYFKLDLTPPYYLPCIKFCFRFLYYNHK